MNNPLLLPAEAKRAQRVQESETALRFKYVLDDLSVHHDGRLFYRGTTKAKPRHGALGKRLTVNRILPSPNSTVFCAAYSLSVVHVMTGDEKVQIMEAAVSMRSLKRGAISTRSRRSNSG